MFSIKFTLHKYSNKIKSNLPFFVFAIQVIYARSAYFVLILNLQNKENRINFRLAIRISVFLHLA